MSAARDQAAHSVALSAIRRLVHVLLLKVVNAALPCPPAAACFACPGTCTGTPHPPQRPQSSAMASPRSQLYADPRDWLPRPVSRHAGSHDVPTGCSLQECGVETYPVQTGEHSPYTLQMRPYLELRGDLHFLSGIARHICQHCQRSRIGWLLHRHQLMLQSDSCRQQCPSRCTGGDEG